MLIYFLKFALGVLIFIAYRFAATRGGGWMIYAGGMLLTFPALNGVGLLVADANPRVAAEAMLPMIALNGLLAAGIIHTLLRPKTLKASVPRGRALAAMSMATTVWVAAALTLNHWNVDLPAAFHPWFIAAYVLVGLAAATMSPQGVAGRSLAKQSRFFESEAKTILRFALLLLFLSGAASLGAGHYSIAQLSAFPLLPFFGLYATSQQANASEALHALRKTVLLGPPLAMSFVTLAAPCIKASAAPSAILRNAIVLLGGWVLCLAAIAVISALQGWFLRSSQRV